jgi:hypothetical protein
MTRYRLRSKLASSAATVALLVGLFAAPTSLAATANLTLNGGLTSAGTKVTGATPLAVSPGKVAGFYVTVKNDDTSNLPTFFMAASTTATPYGAYWFPSDGTQATGPAHTCQTSPLSCDFGTFSSGAAITVVAAFTLPSGTSNATTNCYPSDPTKRTALQFGVLPDPANDTFVCVDFKFSSNQGNVPGKNKSRGDEFHWMDFVSTKVDPKNEAAQFPYCDLSVTPGDLSDCPTNLLSLNNSTTLSSSNRNLNLQYTKVVAPAQAFDSNHGTSAIHVSDGVATNLCGTDESCLSIVSTGGGFLGETSTVDVNSAQVFSSAWIVTTIGMLGAKASDIDGVVHTYTDELNVAHTDYIGKCPSVDGPDETTPTEGCFWAVSGSGNTAVVTIYTHYNGKLRTF